MNTLASAPRAGGRPRWARVRKRAVVRLLQQQRRPAPAAPYEVLSGTVRIWTRRLSSCSGWAGSFSSRLPRPSALSLLGSTPWNWMRRERTASARWVGATLGLAFLFLGVQAWNWWGLISLRLTASSNLYGFTFFMLTGLHAAHVVGGVVLLSIVFARARAGRYGSGHHPGVTYAAMYWHFLDAIWLLLFAVMVVFA